MNASLPYWLNTFLLVFNVNVRSLWHKKAFWFGSLIFALCLLLLFPFSLGTSVIKRADVQIGCLWAVLEFVAVVSITPAFYAEKEADALDILLCSASSRTAIASGKIAFLSLMMFSLTIPIVLFWTILFNVSVENMLLFISKLLIISVFFCVGTAALGTLVHALTSRSLAKEILQPILFFPLQTGSLLAAVSLSLSILSVNSLSGALGGTTWWFILILYPLIFIASSWLFSTSLFEE